MVVYTEPLSNNLLCVCRMSFIIICFSFYLNKNLTTTNNSQCNFQSTQFLSFVNGLCTHSLTQIQHLNSMKHHNQQLRFAHQFNRLQNGRIACPKCKKSRKFFCYTCYVPVPGLENQLPKVKLPVQIDIIKHQQEIDGKSTAIHAAILASDNVNIYTYPNIPEYSSNIEDGTVSKSIHHIM